MLPRPIEPHGRAGELATEQAAPVVCGLELVEGAEALPVLQHARDRELGDRDRVHTRARREPDVGVGESGRLQLRGARAHALHPAEVGRVRRDVERKVDGDGDVDGGERLPLRVRELWRLVSVRVRFVADAHAAQLVVFHVALGDHTHARIDGRDAVEGGEKRLVVAVPRRADTAPRP